jgi:hypothetical protein
MAKKPAMPVEDALRDAKARARSLEEVRGIDYGAVYEGGQATGEHGIRFHMNRKRGRSALAPDQRLPVSIGGHRVDVLGVGYKPHQGNARAPHDPLQPGISVGNRRQGSTGTLGALVRDLRTGKPCLLSNWHVLNGGPEAEAGDEIVQPGPTDMADGRIVATLDRWLQLGEQFDAAVARLKDGVATSGLLFQTQFRPVATKRPAVGMRLVKSGAVSGVTRARIDGINGSYKLDYTAFNDQEEWMQGFRLVRDDTAPVDALSLPGDSGALWIDSADGAAVGLHFGGEDDASPLNDYALAHPIDDVFARLNIALLV